MVADMFPCRQRSAPGQGTQRDPPGKQPGSREGTERAALPVPILRRPSGYPPALGSSGRTCKGRRWWRATAVPWPRLLLLPSPPVRSLIHARPFPVPIPKANMSP